MNDEKITSPFTIKAIGFQESLAGIDMNGSTLYWLREKGIETYCKNNNITREQYTALRYLVRNLKRRKVGQDIERYLYKLKSRNESLRGEEFENDFSDEMINALKTL